ncbi:hypothetical protein [Thermoactinospora rubra]|uniref:hypothetical protein n=1 Tax=Thermoactinospora rubra TaxID=1088767 RepID=UPI0011805E16|nr:hypothetical protein [Thermoactinospora rubra]
MKSRRLTAASAVLLSIGLSGGAVLLASPLVTQGANAAVLVLDPGFEEPCDAGGVCEPSTPEVTVTVTTTLPTPTPTEQPETTITKTVTPKPSKKSTPKPAPTTQAPPTPTPQPVQSSPQQLPTAPPIVATQTPTPEPSVSLPVVAGQESSPPATAPASDTGESSALEVRAATPERDLRGFTNRLAIPALILVLLALFAVLVFEGRLRRMAHAAAVRKAGPQRPPTDPHGYPAGPGAAGPFPGYPGGTAYAPIISFVPVQTYPSGPVQYAPAYHDPAMYGQAAPPYQEPPAYEPPAYEPPAQDPVVVQPEAVKEYREPFEPVKEYRDPFEPVIPPSEAPPADIPPGGDAPYREPHAPAFDAEHGDPDPWEGRTVEEPRPGFLRDDR